MRISRQFTCYVHSKVVFVRPEAGHDIYCATVAVACCIHNYVCSAACFIDAVNSNSGLINHTLNGRAEVAHHVAQAVEYVFEDSQSVEQKAESASELDGDAVNRTSS